MDHAGFAGSWITARSFCLLPAGKGAESLKHDIIPLTQVVADYLLPRIDYMEAFGLCTTEPGG